MLLLRLWNYLRGYVIILVEGYFLERFINICTHRQVFLWDIQRRNDLTMTLKVSIKGFKMLRPISRKSRCRVRIIKKKGLPFFLNRYKRRKAFVFGIVLFFVLFNLLASFIWDVEISGNKEIRTADILQKLAVLGVKPGVLKYRINADRVAKTLILQIKELSWVSFEIRGTKAKLSIEERRQPPSLIAKDVPCNIVAERDGIIHSIIVKDGREVVKEGDTIVKGQLLVSGVMENEREPGQKRLVHSIAEIKARTWYEGNGITNIKAIEAIRTGNVKSVYTLILFNKKIKLPLNKGIDFQNYDKVELKKVLQVGENFILPFWLVIEEYYENKLVEKELSIEEAKIIARDNALKKLMKIIPDDAKIINQIIDYTQSEEGLITANVIIECIEDIGITEEIGGE
ncbi:MAG: sporulation protein YqfD [Firmicutes bacterium]|nr:sporulation protein YqfD [Bacillota bacterium]